MSNIKKKLLSLDRRNFLKGIYNVGISLPIMDFMLNSSGTAYAQNNQQINKSYLSFYNASTGPSSLMAPTGTGDLSSLSLRNILQKLSQKNNTKDVFQKMSIVSNLYLPMHNLPGNGSFPKANRDSNPGINSTTTLHGEGHIVQFTGIDFNKGNYRSSLDVLMAKQFNIPIDSTIYFAVQRGDQPKDKATFLRFDKDRPNNSDNSHTKYGKAPFTDLTDLLGKFIYNQAPTTPGAENPAIVALKLEKSVLDFISTERISYLKSILPIEGQRKLEQQLDLIRDAEKSIDFTISQNENNNQTTTSMRDPASNSSCAKPNINNSGSELNIASGMTKILKAGAACGSSMIGLIPITLSHSACRPKDIVSTYGVNYTAAHSYHKLSHEYNEDRYKQAHEAMLEWHYDVFLGVAKAFNEIQLGDGTYLDKSLLSLSNEGGWGRAGYGDQTPHGGTDMFASYITGMKNLKIGQHIRPGQSKHICQFHLSLMRAFGYSGKLGDVDQIINELQG